MMLSASHPYPTTERTSSASANQPTLSPPPQTILSTQRPRGSTLPSYSSGSASVVYTSISPERPIHNHEERPQLRKERASTLGSRSLQYQHNQYIEDDPNGHANVALPPIRVSDHEEDPREAYDRDERSKVRDDPPAKSSTYNLGHGGPRLPSIRTMLETRTLPTPNHMLSRGSRTPPPRSPISPQQHTRDYHSHGSVPTSSWNGRGHTVPTAGAGSSGSFHHSSPPPDDNSHAHRQVNHNGVGGVQTPMSSSSSVASSLSSQPVSLPPSSPQRDFRSRMSLASAGASILSLTAPFRHKRQQVSGATSPIRQYEPPPRGSFEDSEYSSTARSTPRHVSEELSGSLGRGYFGAQTIPSGVNQSLTSSHSNVSSSAGSFSVMSESDGGTFSNRSRVGETAGGKKRRSRATQEQLEILNAVYQRTPFPSTSERYDLSERLGMTQRSVQIWFQNKRQGAKHSESRRREHPMPLSVISHGSPSLAPLSLVGSLLPMTVADAHRSPPSPPPSTMNFEPGRMQLPTHRSISHGSSLAPIGMDALNGRSRRRGMSVNDLLSQDRHPHISHSQLRNGTGYETGQDDEMES